jgi:hypothetical protein
MASRIFISFAPNPQIPLDFNFRQYTLECGQKESQRKCKDAPAVQIFPQGKAALLNIGTLILSEFPYNRLSNNESTILRKRINVSIN